MDLATNCSPATSLSLPLYVVLLRFAGGADFGAGGEIVVGSEEVGGISLRLSYETFRFEVVVVIMLLFCSASILLFLYLGRCRSGWVLRALVCESFVELLVSPPSGGRLVPPSSAGKRGTILQSLICCLEFGCTSAPMLVCCLLDMIAGCLPFAVLDRNLSGEFFFAINTEERSNASISSLLIRGTTYPSMNPSLWSILSESGDDGLSWASSQAAIRSLDIVKSQLIPNAQKVNCDRGLLIVKAENNSKLCLWTHLDDAHNRVEHCRFWRWVELIAGIPDTTLAVRGPLYGYAGFASLFCGFRAASGAAAAIRTVHQVAV